MAIGIGVEFGPGFIRVLVVARRGAGLELVQAREAACDPDDPQALGLTLTRLAQELRVRQPVVIGLPATSAMAAMVHPLLPNPQRAALAVQFELQQQLPVAASDVAWDFQWLSNGAATRVGARPPLESPEPPRAAFVAAVTRSLIDERLACCQRAGLAVGAVGLNAVAAVNAWQRRRTPGGDAAGSVLLMHVLNERAAEWVLWRGDACHVMPLVGGPDEPWWQALAASWEALRERDPALPTDAWVSCPTALWPRCQEVLSAQCALQVHDFELSQVVSGGAEGLKRQAASWVAAVGLALQGLGLARVPINVLAAAQRRTRQARSRRIAMALSGCGAALIVIFGISGMLRVRAQRARILSALQEQHRVYQTLRPEARALLKRQEQWQHRLSQLEGLARDATLLTRVLAQVAEELPEEIWLTKFEVTKPAVRGRSAAEPTSRIEGLLEGRARSFQVLTQFMDRLKSTVGVSSVQPLSTNVTADPAGGKETVAFTVQIQGPLAEAESPKSDAPPPPKPRDVKEARAAATPASPKSGGPKAKPEPPRAAPQNTPPTTKKPATTPAPSAASR